MSELVLPLKGKLLAFESENFLFSSLRDEDISDEYIGWLNNPKINTFLEAGKVKQDFFTISNYVNYLRSFSDCDLFTIRYRKNMLHVGNLTLTFNQDLRVGTYGLMIGLHDQPVGSLAAVESSIAMIDYVFYILGKERDLQQVNPDNTKALKLIDFLGFKEIVNPSEKGNRVFEITRDHWFSNREKYFNFSKVTEVLN